MTDDLSVILSTGFVFFFIVLECDFFVSLMFYVVLELCFRLLCVLFWVVHLFVNCNYMYELSAISVISCSVI